MSALLVLATLLIASAYRLRGYLSRNDGTRWRQALAIRAILLLICAARAAVGGIPAADCEHLHCRLQG